MWHAYEEREFYAEWWYENLKDRERWEDLDVDGKVILRSI